MKFDKLEEAYTSFLEQNKERLGENTEEFAEFAKTYERDFYEGIENDKTLGKVLIEGDRLIIREAQIKDADFMRRLELDEDTCPWVANWPLGWRVAKLGDPDFLQVLLTLKDGTPIGFIIFRNMLHKENEVQLKRIAILDKGKGYGKEALYLAQKMAFEIFNTKYLYLTTKKENLRAQAVYKKTGFVSDRPDPCTRFHMEMEDYMKKKLKEPSKNPLQEYSTSDKDLTELFEFRSIHPDEIEQAIAIEQICFPPNEACSPKNMRDRIVKAPELFLVAVDKETGKIAGFLNGLSTNESIFRDEFFTDANLYQSEGRNVMLLGLDVLPEYRRQGLAREIVSQYKSRERENNRQMLILTCLDSKVEMYKKMGFKDNGIAQSSWGGEEWHEMSCMIEYN